MRPTKTQTGKPSSSPRPGRNTLKSMKSSSNNDTVRTGGEANMTPEDLKLTKNQTTAPSKFKDQPTLQQENS